MQEAHPDFKKLFILGDSEKSCVQLESDLANLKNLIFTDACHPDPSPRSAYSNIDSNGRPTAATKGRMGFSIYFLDNLYVSSRGGLKISVSAGGEGYPFNSVQLDYFQPTRHDMLDLDLQERLLQIVIDHWPVEHAVLTSGDLMEKTDMPLDAARTRFMEVGWLTYSRNSERGQVMPPDVKWKPFGPGGVLITAMQHQPSPDNHNDVERLISIRDALNAKGLLKATWAKS